MTLELVTASEGDPTPLDDPQLFFNRELSHVRLIERVLHQATDATVPLLERLRFLTICSTLLDEFFEIRVAGLKQLQRAEVGTAGPDGRSPSEVLVEVSQQVHRLVQRQYAILQDDMLPALKGEGIVLLRRTEFTTEQRAWSHRKFEEEVRPVLTPIALDPAHPFPQVLNKSLNFAIHLDGLDSFGRSVQLVVLQVPRCLPRIHRIPDELSGGRHVFVALSSIVHHGAAALFPGMTVQSCYQFRVTRDADLWLDLEEVEDLRTALVGSLPERRYGDAVRLEVADNCSAEVAEDLAEQHGLVPDDVYQVNGPVNLHRLGAIYSQVDRPDLKYPGVTPCLPEGLGIDDPFSAAKRGDVLLHHPYQPFTPVVELLRRAAADPKVLAIKQTLYRTLPDSDLVRALIDAARAGKAVTVLVELRARFDEAANIDVANKLIDAGANVVYGVVGFKTHAKMLLIVRREGKKLCRYVHLGTGNYHAATARVYTDFGYISRDPALGRDVEDLFMQLTGAGAAPSLRRIIASPFGLFDHLLDCIGNEADAARGGRPSGIRARMNALTEPRIIQALYRASQAGVPIDLLVRGVCRLRPGVPDISETIRVRSTIGRFLEHSRVFHFVHGGDDVVYLSSADWMERNLHRRVEATVPITDPVLRQRIVREGLDVHFADARGGWDLQPDGSYVQANGPGSPAQDALVQELAKKA